MRQSYHAALVALFAEGVDRNQMMMDFGQTVEQVALFAEGVDRNAMAPFLTSARMSRPLRGGRG